MGGEAIGQAEAGCLRLFRKRGDLGDWGHGDIDLFLEASLAQKLGDGDKAKVAG